MKFSANKKNRKYIIIGAVVLLGLIGTVTDKDDKVDKTDSLSLSAANAVMQSADMETQAPTDTSTPIPTPEPTATPTQTPAPTPEPTAVPETKTIYLKDNASVEVPYGAEYCGSKRSEVFHYIWCNSVGDIKLSNFVLYDSVEDALAHGKRPCKRCEP